MTSVIDQRDQAAAITQWTTYEFPLNERIRTLLRLEDLFRKFEFFARREHKLDHHSALLALFEIIEVGSRADLKSDLIQELDRQKQVLAQYASHPGVDTKILEQTLYKIDEVSLHLARLSGRLGHHLRDNEFLMIIRSRCSIPGGVCEFDLPGYHRWQSMPVEERRRDIAEWFAPMKPLSEAIQLILQILRDSGEVSRVTSKEGNFTQQMSGKVFQMLRVDIPVELDVIPEFSANKYMLWIRFNRPVANGLSKNNPYIDPFDFRIRFCNF